MAPSPLFVGLAFALAAALFVAPAPVDALPPGSLSVALTQGALNRLRDVLLPYINSKFQPINLPPVTIQQNVIWPIGEIDLYLTNIVLSKLTIGEANFVLSQPASLAFTLDNLNFDLNLNWQWKQKDWPHASDSGSLTANPTGGDITLTTSVQIVNGYPHITASNVNVDFSSFNLDFHGGVVSWLMNVIADLFQGLIKNEIDSQVATALSNGINTIVNQKIASLPLMYFLGQGDAIVDIDYSFITMDAVPFNGSSLALSTLDTMGVGDNATNMGCPFAPAALPAVLQPSPSVPDGLVQFFVADVFTNCLLWVEFINEQITTTITPSMLPPKFPLELNTTAWAQIIPALAQTYPGQAMELVLSAVTLPTLVTDPVHGVTASGEFAMNITVLNPNAYALTLGFGLDLGIDIAVESTSSGQTLLTGTVNALSLNVSLIQSEIGHVSTSTLQLLINIFEPVAENLVNAILAKGFNIMPTGPGFKLVNPQIIWASGYFGVTSDFSYDAFAAFDG